MRYKCKINVKNETKVNKAINEVQANARTRFIYYRDIIEYVNRIERKFVKLGVNKKDQLGAKFSIDDNAFKKPACYKGQPESTQFTIERFKSGWFITCIGRTFSKQDRISFDNEADFKQFYSIRW